MKPRTLYPSALEDWWLQRLQQRYGDTETAKLYSRIEPHVRQVSDSFTRDRAAQFSQSYQGRENLLAYGVFFSPQTYGRTLLALEELTTVHGWAPPPGDKFRVLDLGSGLGAASLAVIDHFRGHPHGLEVTPVEQYTPSAESHQRLVREIPAYGQPVRWNFIPGDFRKIENWAPRQNFRWDLIVLSFSLNEAFAEESPDTTAGWLNQILGRLNPGGMLLVLEPALKETSERLESVRDLLLESGKNHIWAPCLHRALCPARAGGQFWCHEARKWTPPSSLGRLNKNLHREIETLKFSFLALSRTPPPARTGGAGLTRMVSPVSKTQGRLHFHGCSAQGTIGHYDLLTRHLDAAAKKAWWETERGSVLRLEVRPLGSPDNYRINGTTEDAPPGAGDKRDGGRGTTA